LRFVQKSLRTLL